MRINGKLATPLAGMGLTLALLGGATAAYAGTAPASSAQSGSPTRSVVTLEPCQGTGIAPSGVCWMVLEPHLQILGTGPSLWVQHIHWSHWNGQSARGVGQIIGADAGITDLGRVVITLYRPRWSATATQDGGWHYFTRLHTSRSTGHKYHQVAATWVWSASSGEWCYEGCPG